jgi:hypothetical protein
LGSGENRLDDVRRQEGQRHEAAHIAFAMSFGFGDTRSTRSRPSPLQRAADLRRPGIQ